MDIFQSVSCIVLSTQSRQVRIFNFHIFPIVSILQGHHYPMCEMLGVGCDEHIIVNDTKMDHLQRDGMQPHKYSNIYKRSNNLIE